jgi:mycofactocin system glycosyltransferase
VTAPPPAGKPPTTPDLPAGARLTLDGTAQRLDGGRTLLGGSPLRVLRLSAAGARVVDRWLAGDPVAAGPQQRLARRLVETGIAHPAFPPGRYAPGDVTAVIPVHAADVGPLRESLAEMAEVVVVDDGSPVPVPGARVRHPTARGPAAARNAGWPHAGTDLVAFVDADCRPEPGWLAPLLPHFADPAVVAVAPRITSTPGHSTLARYESARSSLDLGPLPGPVRPGSRTGYVPTAALVVRRAALEGAGGFDEALRYGEDVDLVWRLVAAGGVVRYEPAATVRHAPRGTVPAWLRQRYSYGTSAAPLAARHGEAVAPVRVSRWSAAAWGLAAAGSPVAGALVAAGTAALLPRKLRPVGVPAPVALRLAASGHLAAGRLLADALLRTWWPAAALAATRSRRARLLLAAAALPHLVEWRRTRPPVGPLPWLALRVADDLAYGAGVWAGCWRERSTTALRPDLSDWPGQTGIQGTAVQDTTT